MPSRDNSICSVIDLGTNTCLLLTARMKEGRPETIYEAQETPRIGKGLYDTGQISLEGFIRAGEVIAKYKTISEELGAGKILAFGTSALRDASNRDEFIDYIESATGLRIRVISGKEEAESAFAGAVYDLPEDDYAVLDIGGGSTELSFYESGVLISESTDAGSVRITEKFLANGLTEQSMATARDFVRKKIRELPAFSGRKKLIGVAGTLTTLSAIRQGLKQFDFDKIHGDRISLNDALAITKRLSLMSESERRNLGLFMEGRSDIITAGAVILTEFMEYLRADYIAISAKGLRYGLLLLFVDFSNDS